MPRRVPPSPSAPARLLVIALLLTPIGACTGDGDGGADPADLAERLSAAREAIDSAETVDISLTTDELPDGITGLVSAVGQGTPEPTAFTGDVTVQTGGSNLGAEVIAVDGQVFAKTGFSDGFLTIQPATLGAPDPATLFDPETGVSQILEATDGLTEAERTRDGEEVLTTIEGTLPGALVSGIIPEAQQDAVFDVRYRLSDDDTLADARISGPFYPGTEADVTYTVRMEPTSEPVTISAPPNPGGGGADGGGPAGDGSGGEAGGGAGGGAG